MKRLSYILLALVIQSTACTFPGNLENKFQLSDKQLLKSENTKTESFSIKSINNIPDKAYYLTLEISGDFSPSIKRVVTLNIDENGKLIDSVKPSTIPVIPGDFRKITVLAKDQNNKVIASASKVLDIKINTSEAIELNLSKFSSVSGTVTYSDSSPGKRLPVSVGKNISGEFTDYRLLKSFSTIAGESAEYLHNIFTDIYLIGDRLNMTYTDENGRYKLDNIPEGENEIFVGYRPDIEILGVKTPIPGQKTETISQKFTISSNKSETVDLKISTNSPFVTRETIKEENTDIPDDPKEQNIPEIVIDGDLKPSASIKEDETKKGRFAINLGGMINPNTNQPINLSSEDITVIENYIQKAVKFSKLDTTTLPIDVVLVIDTTGSMKEEINGVKNSLIDFVNDLETRNLNVNVGAVSYRDSLFNSNIDSSDPAANTIESFEYLTNDKTKILDFISSLISSGEGNRFAPEGLLDSIFWAFNSGKGVSSTGESKLNFGWREGSQKIFIVLTDAPTWEKGGQEISSKSPWTVPLLADRLKNENVVVHVISPDFSNNYISNYFFENSGVPKGLATELSKSNYSGESSKGTGGSWKELPLDGNVNLKELDISSILANSIKLEFVSYDRAKNKAYEKENVIRVIVKKGDLKGETLLRTLY